MTIRTLTTQSGYLINEYKLSADEAQTLIQVLIKNGVRFEVTP